MEHLEPKLPKRIAIIGDTAICTTVASRLSNTMSTVRITQSGLGCTINGYNFREDLLRGIGNGVVEQTAAKDFIDLLSKF